MPRILIAEDDPTQRRLMQLILAGDEFELLEASDGHEALRLALDHQPAVAFLDWQMPGPSGIEVCRAIRQSEIGSTMHIVMLSGRGMAEDRRAAFAAGASDYLVKPFSPIDVLNKVAALMGPEALA